MASDGYGDALSAELAVVTAVRYDVTAHALQVKTRPVKVLVAGAESDWTTITGGEAAACPS